MIHSLMLLLAGTWPDGPHDLKTAPQEHGRPAAPGGKAAGESDWSASWRTEGEFRYNSNVWHLDGDDQDRLENPVPAYDSNGRFDGMESVDDFVFRPEMRFDVKGPSPLGRKLDARVSLGYDQYFENADRSHLRAGLGLGQSVGADGRLTLALDFVPDYFRKNYLADAVDSNGNGNISQAERRYDRGTYDEASLALSYTQDLLKRVGKGSPEMDGRISLGYRDQSFDSPFSGRDEEAFWARLGIRFSLGLGPSETILKCGVYYEYADVESPTRNEVVLIDETVFGDANGDAFIAPNARVVQPVDRGHLQNQFGLFVELALLRNLDVGVSYARTLKDYDSNERLDVAHTGREDTRDEVEIFLQYGFMKGWSCRVGYEWRAQDTDRPNDPGSVGETTDYQRTIVSLSVAHRW